MAERPDRIFVGFDSEHGGSGDPLPIRAIVFLREADEVAVEEVPRVTALRDLWRLSFRTGTVADRADSFQRLASLAGSVASWNLYRPLTLNSLEKTVELIRNSLAKRMT